MHTIYMGINRMIKKLFLGLMVVVSFSSLATPRADEAWKQLDNGAILIDVRTEGEYATKHLPNSINVPVNQISYYIQKLPKDKNIVLYCRSGRRAGQVLDYMKRDGFTQVVNGGGLEEMLTSQPQ